MKGDMKMKDTNVSLYEKAHMKINELLNCGNERVELAAAKELLTVDAKDDSDNNVRLEVTIKVV